jgi:CelD/BcsL family acetyltransferase involved in cellulose biosynthesis
VEAAEPNVFFEPWFLLPALRSFHSERRVLLALIWGNDSAGREQLYGLFPLEFGFAQRALPIAVARVFRFDYCALCTPLIHRDHVQTVWRRVLQWCSELPQHHMLELKLMGGDGPVWRGLHNELSETVGFDVSEQTSDRALWAHEVDGGATLSLSSRKRADLRRLERRLGETGTVRYAEFANGELSRWVEDFLWLEASGWKGAAGTAFANRPNRRAFFGAICHSAAAHGRLHMLQLRLDKRPVAQICQFSAQEGLFAFRIAYDEAYAKYSPGLLLSLHHTALVNKRHVHHWIDSCGASNSPMVNRIWRARRRLVDVRIASRLRGSRIAFNLLDRLDRLRQRKTLKQEVR